MTIGHASELLPDPMRGFQAPCFQRFKIIVSDTSGAINATTSKYPPTGTATRNSAGQYTLTLPAMHDVTVTTGIMGSAAVTRSSQAESIATSDATTTIVVQVASIGTTPAAADLVTALDQLHVHIFGSLRAD